MTENGAPHATPTTAGLETENAAEALEREWETSARWKGIQRDHSAADVLRLRGSFTIEHSLARRGATRFWDMVTTQPFVPALGALTGNQAVQMVRAGVPAIYLSGWQVAADNNLDGETYPDLSLYPVNSVPTLVARLNRALLRADQIESVDGQPTRDWLAPIVADAEAGFGGPLNAYALMQHMIEAGAAAVHFEDQLSTAKKCGHMGGKVLVPTLQHVRTLRAARLAADVLDVPSVIIARTDARGATLVASDTDVRDQPFLTGKRTREGHFETRSGLDSAIARGISYAPYAEMLWFETNEPDLDEAQRFAAAIHAEHPGKLLAYNLSPSFRWTQHLEPREIADFQAELGKLGFRFQFVTLAGYHANASAMFALARDYMRSGMAGYVRLQEHEFTQRADGYTAVAHQKEAGTGYFDRVASVISPGDTSTLALPGSTEESFEPAMAPAATPRRKPRAAPEE